MIDNKDVIEKPLISQEYISLKRSSHERRKNILDDYIVYLQKWKFYFSMMKEDPEKLHQPLKS
jgi:hypothetical protein